MKKIFIVFLCVLLLSACGEKLPEYSEPEEDISLDDVVIDYSQTAHDRLENDTSIPVDEEVSEDESTSEASEEVSEEETTSESEQQSSSTAESEAVVSIPDESEDASAESNDGSESESLESVTLPTRERILLITADIGYADGTSATLVCGADGTVDLYFGNGVAFEDMEQHEDVLQQAMILVELGRTYYSRGERQLEYPFPAAGTTYIYIKTEHNVYRIEYNNTVTGEGYLMELERAVSSTVLAITMKAEQ